MGWGYSKTCSGLLSNRGEKSINFDFIMVPLTKKVLKYGTPKPSVSAHQAANSTHIHLSSPRANPTS